MADECKMWQPQFWSFFNMRSNDGWETEGGKLEKTTCSGIPFFGGAHKLGAGATVSRVV
jgi:hypothetical protein